MTTKLKTQKKARTSETFGINYDAQNTINYTEKYAHDNRKLSMRHNANMTQIVIPQTYLVDEIPCKITKV